MTWHDAVETGTKDWLRTSGTSEFAREFLLAAMDEGVPIQIALGKVIRAMGVKEFAGKARMASPNVLQAIHPRHNPTQNTLNRLLKPFRLRLEPRSARRSSESPCGVNSAPLRNPRHHRSRLARAGVHDRDIL